jgi:AraC-like DNA-binding protein
MASTLDRRNNRGLELRRLRMVNASRAADPIPPRLKPRGIPPALAHHQVFATDVASEAELNGRDIFGDHRLRVDDDEFDFTASLHAVRFRDITMGYLDFVAAIEISASRLHDDYLVLMPMNGSSRTVNEGRTVEATSITAVSPTPGTAMTMSFRPHSPHLLISIPHDILEAHLARLLGRSLHQRLRFDLALDMSPDSANRWNSAIQLLHTELFHDNSLLHHGIGTGSLEEFVMSALLFVHNSNFSAALARPERLPGRRAIRIARDFIDSRLSESITISDIAAAAQISVRSLQEGFRSELRCSPTMYIRDGRLDRVRVELADAALTDGVTVTDVAVKWGFCHLGRFASVYKQRFGESPSQTLRS